ncbi:MAG: gcvH [Chlamydiales bacterium]|jgi:glycine cleavage system H protein|nr:gcvH [Chlamydiales bacterium]
MKIGNDIVKYTESHEWIKINGDIGTVGISKYAQQELGEIVYVELPMVGCNVLADEAIVVLESTKAAADVYTPVSGCILSVNESLREDLASINECPETIGWLYTIRLAEPLELDVLLDRNNYLKRIGLNVVP